MDDVSKLGPLWVSQLRKEIASRRNRAAESLLTIKPDGDYAKQHRMLIEAADAMLEAQGLLEALREIAAGNYHMADVVALEALEDAGLSAEGK